MATQTTPSTTTSQPPNAQDVAAVPRGLELHDMRCGNCPEKAPAPPPRRTPWYKVLVVSRWEHQLDSQKLKQSMQHPIAIGEEVESSQEQHSRSASTQQ